MAAAGPLSAISCCISCMLSRAAVAGLVVLSVMRLSRLERPVLTF
jgi:hypothetical protein